MKFKTLLISTALLLTVLIAACGGSGLKEPDSKGPTLQTVQGTLVPQANGEEATLLANIKNLSIGLAWFSLDLTGGSSIPPVKISNFPVSFEGKFPSQFSVKISDKPETDMLFVNSKTESGKLVKKNLLQREFVNKLPEDFEIGFAAIFVFEDQNQNGVYDGASEIYCNILDFEKDQVYCNWPADGEPILGYTLDYVVGWLYFDKDKYEAEPCTSAKDVSSLTFDVNPDDTKSLKDDEGNPVQICSIIAAGDILAWFPYYQQEEMCQMDPNGNVLSCSGSISDGNYWLSGKLGYNVYKREGAEFNRLGEEDNITIYLTATAFSKDADPFKGVTEMAIYQKVYEEECGALLPCHPELEAQCDSIELTEPSSTFAIYQMPIAIEVRKMIADCMEAIKTHACDEEYLMVFDIEECQDVADYFPFVSVPKVKDI